MTVSIPLSDKARQTAALTVYGEARGEAPLGRVAVAWVIRNRVEHPRWWGRSVESVCLYPWQFSCWLAADPNSKLLNPDVAERDPSFWRCEATVERVFEGLEADPTHGANHYLVTKAASHTAWASHATPTAIIGNHSFYRLET